uniref:Peptidyl-prolyl cis-trans isomerase CYP38, chloroplastic n=1 Tax=Tanacetum cinerariifolium TaxID=118510 RepID=A0A699JR85_TANCI|nr:peptidyl-prolyl cis-trans isomerase CYP38, chloroplastic [Tanacetum cinerariifolium]
MDGDSSGSKFEYGGVFVKFKFLMCETFLELELIFIIMNIEGWPYIKIWKVLKLYLAHNLAKSTGIDIRRNFKQASRALKQGKSMIIFSGLAESKKNHAIVFLAKLEAGMDKLQKSQRIENKKLWFTHGANVKKNATEPS